MTEHTHIPPDCLTAHDRKRVQYMRQCGMSLKAIADYFKTSRYSLARFIAKHDLKQGQGEGQAQGQGQPLMPEISALRMRLYFALDETCARLRTEPLNATDYCRLSGLQIRLIAALIRHVEAENSPKETRIMRQDEEADKRLETMSMEDLHNEIRCLAGLEGKSLETNSGSADTDRRRPASGAQSLSDTGTARPETAR